MGTITTPVEIKRNIYTDYRVPLFALIDASKEGKVEELKSRALALIRINEIKVRAIHASSETVIDLIRNNYDDDIRVEFNRLLKRLEHNKRQVQAYLKDKIIQLDKRSKLTGIGAEVKMLTQNLTKQMIKLETIINSFNDRRCPDDNRLYDYLVDNS